MECDVCSEKRGANLKIFPCDGCNTNMCTKCSCVTGSEIKVLELKNGRKMRFLCPKCLQSDTFTLLHQTIEDKIRIIESKEEIIALLKAKIEDLEGESNKNASMPLYSRIVQSSVGGISPRKGSNNIGNIPSLIIAPKQSQNADVTRKNIQLKINPTELKVGIKNTRLLKNGNVIVKCYNRKDIDTLREEAEKKTGRI